MASYESQLMEEKGAEEEKGDGKKVEINMAAIGKIKKSNT